MYYYKQNKKNSMKTEEELKSLGFVDLDCVGGISTPDSVSLYKINKEGDIYSLRSKRILNKLPHTLGYVQTYITNYYGGGRWYKLHRLVAMQFIANPHNLTDINHINGNKKDNRVENLEWLSHSDNIKHSYMVLGRKHNPKKSYKRVFCITTGIEYESFKSASESTGCKIPNICNCCKGNIKQTKGYKFRYV